MTMNALATTNGNTLSIPSNETFDVLYRIAKVGAAAASMRKKPLRPEEAMYIILHGYALNIDPMVALNQIYIVNGTPTCSAQLMIALANKSGILSRLDIPDPGEVTDSATVVAVRKDRPDNEYRATFTMNMAEAAGLSKKDNWTKHQGQMLIARAVSACLRKAVPEAIAGMYAVEEIEPDVVVDDAGMPSSGTPQVIVGKITPPELPAQVETADANGSEQPSAAQDAPDAAEQGKDAPTPTKPAKKRSTGRKSGKNKPSDVAAEFPPGELVHLLLTEYFLADEFTGAGDLTATLIELVTNEVIAKDTPANEMAAAIRKHLDALSDALEAETEAMREAEAAAQS